tara:strand:+ start:2067 stop:2708 length:642 start_codon:yes stop_codon:yes gene_type:complete
MNKDGLVYGPVGGIGGLAALLLLLQRRKAMQNNRKNNETQTPQKPLKESEISIHDSMGLARTPEIRKNAVAIQSGHLNLERGKIVRIPGDSLSNSNATPNSELSFNDDIASPTIEVTYSSEGSSSEDSSDKQKKSATQRRLDLETTHVHESEIPPLVSNTSASRKITTPVVELGDITPSVSETSSNEDGSKKSVDTSPIGSVKGLRAVFENRQ